MGKRHKFSISRPRESANSIDLQSCQTAFSPIAPWINTTIHTDTQSPRSTTRRIVDYGTSLGFRRECIHSPKKEDDNHKWKIEKKERKKSGLFRIPQGNATCSISQILAPPYSPARSETGGMIDGRRFRWEGSSKINF